MDIFIFIGSIFCSFISAYLLFFKSKKYQIYSNRLLGILLISSALLVLVYLLIKTRWIIHVPYLYKIVAPINFITTPLCYLYVRAVIYNESKWSKNDFYLFIPSFIVCLNYLPFFFMNGEDKLKIVQSLNIESPSTLLVKGLLIPDQILSIFWLIQCIIYLLLIWRFLLQFDIKNTIQKFESHTKLVYKWLKLFAILNTMIGIGIIIYSFAIVFSRNLYKYIPEFLSPNLLVSTCFLMMCGYLLIHPHVLFGLPYELDIQDPRSFKQQKLDKNKANFDEFESKINQINIYIQEQKPYLIASLDVYTLANLIDIPSRELSFILNNCFEKNFNDFVNQHRIDYVNEKIKGGYLDKYKLEALYLKAGFTSKSTFNAAFKKVNQCTPTEYLEKLAIIPS
jgi:AraC-like DNA-binding protein